MRRAVGVLSLRRTAVDFPWNFLAVVFRRCPPDKKEERVAVYNVRFTRIIAGHAAKLVLVEAFRAVPLQRRAQNEEKSEAAVLGQLLLYKRAKRSELSVCWRRKESKKAT